MLTARVVRGDKGGIGLVANTITRDIATGIMVITRKTIMECLDSLVPAQHLRRLLHPRRRRLSPAKQRLFNRRQHRRLLRRLLQVRWE